MAAGVEKASADKQHSQGKRQRGWRHGVCTTQSRGVTPSRHPRLPTGRAGVSPYSPWQWVTCCPCTQKGAQLSPCHSKLSILSSSLLGTPSFPPIEAVEGLAGLPGLAG